MEEMENGVMPAGQPAQESAPDGAHEAGGTQGAQGAAAPAWEDTPPLGGEELKQMAEAANRAQSGPAPKAQGEGIPGGKPPVPNEVWKTARLRAEREAAARYAQGSAPQGEAYAVCAGRGVRYAVPQRVSTGAKGTLEIYFRVDNVYRGETLEVRSGDEVVFRRKRPVMTPGEMEKIEIDLGSVGADLTVQLADPA